MFPCSFRLLKLKTKRRARKVLKMYRAPELFTSTEFPSYFFFQNVRKACELVLEFCLSFCEKLFELKAKYSDKIHQAVKCLHKTLHVGSKFCFKTAQGASNFSQSISVFLLNKR